MADLPQRILLASASPRRRELLLQIGITPVVVPAEIDETTIRHEDPIRLCVELARAKARAVMRRLEDAPLPQTAGLNGSTDPDADGRLPLLAADTVVAAGGEILEKPADRSDARRMLEMLSGRTHRVITGLAVAAGRSVAGANEARWEQDPGDALVTRYAESHVTFAELGEREIEAYLDSAQWQDVAGAYRIQGLAACHVSALRGSYSNVVGLPLHLVYSILTEQPST